MIEVREALLDLFGVVERAATPRGGDQDEMLEPHAPAYRSRRPRCTGVGNLFRGRHGFNGRAPDDTAEPIIHVIDDDGAVREVLLDLFMVSNKRAA
jgi:hypothetical protein